VFHHAEASQGKPLISPLQKEAQIEGGPFLFKPEQDMLCHANRDGQIKPCDDMEILC
jgi:hypothetical protein